MHPRHRLLLIVSLLLVVAAWQARTASQAALAPSPREAFGADIGQDYFLASYTQLEQYWTALADASERMALVEIGRTEEDRPQLMAIISAPENIVALDRYRDISRRLALAEGLDEAEARALAEAGRAVVWINGGLHADEVLGAQSLTSS